MASFLPRALLAPRLAVAALGPQPALLHTSAVCEAIIEKTRGHTKKAKEREVRNARRALQQSVKLARKEARESGMEKDVLQAYKELEQEQLAEQRMARVMQAQHTAAPAAL
eukprot:TRINITY_DN3014_c0_g1_i1.p3 TRINITY_DN3014_c0_g1~~TRINITY_DN3014_c0_g1_i1.p3  ORF type:complete len:124 (+),score=32.31 TRINITY_DN3014_c0_g1_i1:41-373(+)